MTDRSSTTRRRALKVGAVGSFGPFTGLVPRPSQGAPEGIEECTTIDEPGEYELENDITGGGTLGPDDDACIDIEGVSGVTLDGNGYVLEGDGDGAGIRVSSGGVTIRNLTVRGFEEGFKTELGPRMTIRSATIEQNTVGIDGDLSEITCTNSVIRENDGAGISSYDGVGLIVRDCEIRDNGGTPVGDCCRGRVVIEDCTIVGNDGTVNLIPVPGTRIEGTEIAESTGSGITTSVGDRGNTADEPVRIIDSYIHDNDGPGISHRNGYFEVRECTLSGNEDGYRSESAHGGGAAVLRYNNIEDNEGYGAFLKRGVEVDAECNYWGDETGPKHPDNPRSDPEGQRVSAGIDVVPWSVERIDGGEGVCIGGQERVGYISLSSFRKVIGEDDVDCVPDADGWGGRFYVRRPARNGWSAEGVVLDVPNASRSYRGYLIAAEADTDPTGGPSGEGPWGENCSSWLFVDESRDVQFDVEHTVHDPEPTVAHGAVQPTNGDGENVGLPLDLVPTTFAPFADVE